MAEGHLLTVHTYCESSKSLEGDCGMDRVPRCRLLTPFKEGTHLKLLAQEKNLNSASKVVTVDILKYFNYCLLLSFFFICTS